MWYKKATQGLISSIQDTDRLGFAGAMGIGPWVVPLAPAIIFGWALYESAPANMDIRLRVVAGSAAALGLVVAGAVSSHNAISLQISGIEGKNLRFAWGLVFSYIGLEILGLWFMSIDTQIKIVGTVVSLLTLIVYLSRSAMSRLSEAKQDKVQTKQLEREDNLADKAHQRDLERRQLEIEREKDLAKIEANKEKAIAKLSVPKSVPSGATNDTPELTPDEQKTRILHYMESAPDMTMTQLAQTIGTSRRTLYRRLDELKTEGKVKVNGAGYEINH